MSDLQTLIEGATDEQIAFLEQLDDRVLNGYGGTVEAFREHLTAMLEHREAIRAPDAATIQEGLAQFEIHDWSDVPVPRRLHRCQAVYWGIVGVYRCERCACGAVRVSNCRWMDRNSRRKR